MQRCSCHLRQCSFVCSNSRTKVVFHNVLPRQWRSQNKTLEGPNCLTLGEEQHFCLGRRFSKNKMTKYSQNLERGMSAWLRLCKTIFFFHPQIRTHTILILAQQFQNVATTKDTLILCALVALRSLKALTVTSLFYHCSSIFCDPDLCLFVQLMC